MLLPFVETSVAHHLNGREDGLLFPACARPRVLVADDYVDAANSLALLLEVWGYEVFIAHTGPQALACARRHRPEVVLLELKLQGMDGFTLAQKLQAEFGDEIVLVALTGLSDATSRRRAQECCFRHYMLKPVEPELLEEVLAWTVPPR